MTFCHAQLDHLVWNIQVFLYHRVLQRSVRMFVGSCHNDHKPSIRSRPTTLVALILPSSFSVPKAVQNTMLAFRLSISIVSLIMTLMSSVALPHIRLHIPRAIASPATHFDHGSQPPGMMQFEIKLPIASSSPDAPTPTILETLLSWVDLAAKERSDTSSCSTLSKGRRRRGHP